MRRGHRRAAGVAAAAAVVAAITVGSVAASRRPGGAGDRPVPVAHREYAVVERRDLVRTSELDGTVGHGDRRTVELAGSGTLTRLPSVGDRIEFGEALVEVDGSPVLLIQGERPAWRSLGPGITRGEDVRQLETWMVAVGYADPDEIDVDDRWTSATTAAVEVMQRWTKMPDDGVLDLGEIVFSPAPVRIAAVGGVLGGAVSGAGIETTGLTQTIGAALPVDDAQRLAVGEVVTVELPSGAEVAATVVTIGRVVVDADGAATLPVTLDAGPLELDDGVPVRIRLVRSAARDVLAVPAEALLALAEGGYALEVADDSAPGGTRLVGVATGAFADGWVEVVGEIEAGTEVVVP